MLYIQKFEPGFTAYILALLVLLLAVFQYGKTAVEWLLIKLHEFFIQRTVT